MSDSPVLFTQAESWKLSLPCTRAEAEALSGDVPALAAIDPSPVVMTSEADPADADAWLLEVFLDQQPDAPAIALVQSLVPSAARARPTIERIEPADWVTLSQRGLDPISAGRFYVHTSAHRGTAAPASTIAFEIEAGQAFGTGHHETTTGCLMMLDRLKRGRARFANIADIGTGTGLLAFGALALWRQARAIASDIDPIAMRVTASNASVNGIRCGTGPGRLELAVAAGLAHRRLKGRAPYDLLIANILAGPLIQLAPSIGASISPGGSVLLAGLLNHQAEAVVAAYRLRGMRLADRITLGDWAILRLVKRNRPGRRG